MQPRLVRFSLAFVAACVVAVSETWELEGSSASDPPAPSSARSSSTPLRATAVETAAATSTAKRPPMSTRLPGAARAETLVHW